jgi:hypothetical protein
MDIGIGGLDNSNRLKLRYFFIVFIFFLLSGCGGDVDS